MEQRSILKDEKAYPKENIVKKDDYTLKVTYYGVSKHGADYPIGSIELKGPDLEISLGSRLTPASLTGLSLVVTSETVTTSTLEAAIVNKYNVRPDVNFLRELLREGLRPYMRVQSPENFW